MDLTQRPPSTSSASGVGRDGIARRLAASAAGVFVVLYFTVTARALDGFQLHNDLGIQYYLARRTSEGAVPLLDFEHGWNTLSWYISAALYRVAGGNATTWVFLWGRGGFILAGLAMLGIAWRIRLPARWIAGLTAAWILLTHVPHNKYAVPTVWALMLLPTRRTTSVGWQRGLRVAAAATVWWAHVELAILLTVGTAMFDVFGARDGRLRERLLTGVHAPLGLLVGLGSQIAVYRLLGMPPAELVRQTVGDWTVTEFGPLFDYPLGAPDTVRMMLFPAVLIVPFVPLLWRRLSDPTRFLAMCNLALGLIAIRRPGDGHVAAAGTLMALVLVLGAFDLSGHGADLVRVLRARARDGVLAVLAPAAGGALWYGVALAAGFRIPSFVAVVVLTIVCLTAVVAALRVDLAAASVGALAAAVLVMTVGVGNHLRLQVGADRAQLQTELITAAVQADARRCVPDGQAWIVPSPLTLYDTLDLQNPTPYYAFWYNLEGQRDVILRSMDASMIPAIVQVSAWPPSMDSLVPEIEQRYDVCARTTVDSTGDIVTFWVARAGG